MILSYIFFFEFQNFYFYNTLVSKFLDVFFLVAISEKTVQSP